MSLAAPALAFGDGTVASSCAILSDAAAAVADRVSDEALPHLGSAWEGPAYERRLGAALLPAAAWQLKLCFPARVATLAHDLRILQTKGRHPELDELITSDKDLLRADLNSAFAAFTRTAPLGGASYGRTGFTFDTLRFNLCSSSFILATEGNEKVVCAQIDLANGETSYELADKWGDGRMIADLGSTFPGALAKDPAALAGFRRSLRLSRIAGLPAVCRKPADERFDLLAETEERLDHIAEARRAKAVSLLGPRADGYAAAAHLAGLLE